MCKEKTCEHPFYAVSWQKQQRMTQRGSENFTKMLNSTKGSAEKSRNYFTPILTEPIPSIRVRREATTRFSTSF